MLIIYAKDRTARLAKIKTLRYTRRRISSQIYKEGEGGND